MYFSFSGDGGGLFEFSSPTTATTTKGEDVVLFFWVLQAQLSSDKLLEGERERESAAVSFQVKHL